MGFGEQSIPAVHRNPDQLAIAQRSAVLFQVQKIKGQIKTYTIEAFVKISTDVSVPI